MIQWYPELKHHYLLCVTESPDQIGYGCLCQGGGLMSKSLAPTGLNLNEPLLWEMDKSRQNRFFHAAS